jgi:TonB family protein
MKKIIILGALILSCFAVDAQKKQNVYFFNKKGKEVKVKDSADFIRVIQEPDSGETNYMLIEFYTNDIKKKQGKVSSFSPALVYEGGLISFDKKGIKKSLVNYEKGKMSGMAYYYFSNGKLRKQVEHLSLDSRNDQMLAASNAVTTKVIFMQDSLGNITVNNGNGHAIEQVDVVKGDTVFEEGDYKDGFKNGVWNGKYAINTKHFYSETYKQGRLIAGENHVDGTLYKYTSWESSPKFKSGLNEWSSFISNTTKYPKDALEVSASGTVITSFVVDKEGNITDIKILKSIHPSLDEEAIRVLRRSPKWIPGKRRGIPIKMLFTQSFKFDRP